MYRFDDERGFYSGQWLRGLRTGTGVEINAQGKYLGRFYKDWRRGNGTLIYANGDVLQSRFTVRLHHEQMSLIRGDEYKDGLPTGPTTITFADGSKFEGTFSNGLPGGHGTFVTSYGHRFEGSFDCYGALHGVGTATMGTVTRVGTFSHGLLHGSGALINVVEGKYEGQFKRGLEDGQGKQESEAFDGVNEGWYACGKRNGYGVYNFYRKTLRNTAENELIRLEREERRRQKDNAQKLIGDGKTLDEVYGIGPFARRPESASASQTSPQRSTLPPRRQLAYRGDYQFDGRFRAGSMRQRGSITVRRGETEPHLFERTFIHNLRNVHLPDLLGLAEREDQERLAREKLVRDHIDQEKQRREHREKENLKSYDYWTHIAGRLMEAYRERTRRTQTEVERVRRYIEGIQHQSEMMKKVREEEANERLRGRPSRSVQQINEVLEEEGQQEGSGRRLLKSALKSAERIRSQRGSSRGTASPPGSGNRGGYSWSDGESPGRSPLPSHRPSGDGPRRSYEQATRSAMVREGSERGGYGASRDDESEASASVRLRSRGDESDRVMVPRRRDQAEARGYLVHEYESARDGSIASDQEPLDDDRHSG